jgi:hypothetical protein
MKQIALILALLPAAVMASDINVSWTNPVKNTDGSDIPATGAGSIASTRVEWGTCSGTAFGIKAGEQVATGTSTTLTGISAASTVCVRAFAKNTYGQESAASNVTSKVIPAPVPLPPVLAVPVIAGMLQTPAYLVTNKGKISQLVGFVDVGAQCIGNPITEYRGSTFYSVDHADVRLWNVSVQSKRTIVAACGS